VPIRGQGGNVVEIIKILIPSG